MQNGLQVIALADHDTTGGIQEALDAARGTALTVIPAVEISTTTGTQFEIHILGYWIDREHTPLQERLSSLRQSRLRRGHKVLDLLAKNGCPVPWERVSDLASGGVVGRPHIAQAMVEARYVDSVETAFRRYLGKGRPAYVPRAKLPPQEALDLVRDAGGVPVLAHPSRIIEHIPALARGGLMGLEAYYGDYLEAETSFLVRLARKHGLIVTGGSDFHGAGITNATAPGATYVPVSVVEDLASRWGAS
jgi:predicted metal-dependent phosphoesterase TrpH